MKYKTEELLLWRYMTWIFERGIINPSGKTLARIKRLERLVAPFLRG